MDVARTIEGLDKEIAAMTRAVDAAEIDRLIAKIAGLGAPPKGDGAAKSQIRPFDPGIIDSSTMERTELPARTEGGRN